ncbi:MAG: hypothetical protein L3J74_08510 [Bacteroidales bacterium]|nr:hypothetical protein [Bacteroidales bacterium]
MEAIGLFLSTALGYILKSATESNAANTAKDELIGAFWQWLRPLFIEDIPEIENKAEEPETQKKAEKKLLELIKDEKFFAELLKKVEELQKAGMKEKNIYKGGDLKRIKKIHIGDKEYKPNDHYDRKNIFEGGSIEDADEFRLGDG